MSNSKGVWIPEHVLELQIKGQINANEILLLAIVGNLSKTKDGCTASNQYLADRIGVKVRYVSRMLGHLKNLGLVQQLAFDGRVRQLAAGWATPDDGPQDTADSARPDGTIVPGALKDPSGPKTEGTLSAPKVADGDDIKEGFGLVVKPPSSIDATDAGNATRLYKALASFLGSTHRIIRGWNTDVWGRQFALLRDKDRYGQQHIEDVLDWYIRNIGKQFVPEAFCAEAFRRKFEAIERQYKRNAFHISTPSQTAIDIATTLQADMWPAGAGKDLPNAIQASLEAYREWWKDFNIFLDYLHEDKVHRSTNRLHTSLGEELQHRLPPPITFVRQWFEDVYKRVCRWSVWNGDLAPMVFTPQAEQFVRMGREIARAYTGDPGRWDAFIEAMNK